MYGYKSTQDLIDSFGDEYSHNDNGEYIEVNEINGGEDQEDMEEVSLDEIFNRYAE